MAGQWKYNTDGIDVCNCKDVKIKDCFLHVFDDVITIKGIGGYQGNHPINMRCNENISIDGCIMWCDWGKTCEIGVETNCEYYKNVEFNHCDCIHNSFAAIDIMPHNSADLRDIRFKNINIEFSKQDRKQTLQETDEQVYFDDEEYMPWTVWMSVGPNNHKIEDILVDNIHIYTEKENEKCKISIDNTQSVFKNIQLKNFYINGKKATKEDIEVHLPNKEDPQIHILDEE